MSPRPAANEIAIGKFKETCLRLLEEVRRTGKPILVTKRGVPVAVVGPVPSEMRRPSWRNAMRGSGRICGDLLAPAAAPEEWEAMRS